MPQQIGTTDITQALFDNARLGLTAVVKLYNGQLDASKGSMLSLLLIRPLAYLFSYIQRFVNSFVQSTSVANLMGNTSSATAMADAVASNYFVERQPGQYATVSIYILARATSILIRPTTLFTIDGHVFYVPTTTVCTIEPKYSTSLLQYIKMYPIGDSYYAILDLYAILPGYVEFLKLTPVLHDSVIAGLISMQLLSDVASGGLQLTDAQLLQRARLSVIAKATGTTLAITQRLKESPIAVLDANSTLPLAGNTRATYNTACVSTSGNVDTFIKTSILRQTLVLDCVAKNTADGCSIIIDPVEYAQAAGAYLIVGIADAGGNILPLYNVEYTSIATSVPALSARLSALQRITINSDSIIPGLRYSVLLTYMPGVKALQDYITNDSISFIGLSILVRAAVPVAVRLAIGLHVNRLLLLLLKLEIRKYIAKLICSTPIGATQLSIDSIRSAVALLFPGVQLMLPCTWTASLLTLTQLRYTFSTVSGILDLNLHKDIYKWNSAGLYIECTSNDVILLVL